MAIQELHRLKPDPRQNSANHESTNDAELVATVTTFDYSELNDVQLIRSLTYTINEAFNLSHVQSRALPASRPRLVDDSAYQTHMGTKGGTLSIVVQHPQSRAVLATVAAKPYIPLSPEEFGKLTGGREIFTRREVPDGAGSQLWEISLLAVSPQYQRRGLASYLMEAVEKRVRQACAARGATDVTFLLCTIKEINGDFYDRKGYKRDYATYQAPGTIGSETGFTVDFMSEVVVIHGQEK
ncbi:hypothetical protein BDZ85DRAFT_252753 [Elsinoe ampelina]|uniref:N-acetyltransferase domain-containing protein n=1 Tax=Elsinoe ampelina TaxID=302913 RepID=A0A6A6G1F9_9PEZI|nr:hypothetical protein BDZ85DRAFT_252753 [Elsinoe ampelina]